MQLDPKSLSLFFGGGSLSLFRGSTAIITGTVPAGGPIVLHRAGLMVAKTLSFADAQVNALGALFVKALPYKPPVVGRLGMLSVKKVPTSPSQVTRAGVLIVRKVPS